MHDRHIMLWTINKLDVVKYQYLETVLISSFAWSMQAVRQKKLSEMEAEGIPAKYRAELARKKMVNW